MSVVFKGVSHPDSSVFMIAAFRTQTIGASSGMISDLDLSATFRPALSENGILETERRLPRMSLCVISPFERFMVQWLHPTSAELSHRAQAQAASPAGILSIAPVAAMAREMDLGSLKALGTASLRRSTPVNCCQFRLFTVHIEAGSAFLSSFMAPTHHAYILCTGMS